jgi:hypothetical protein
MVWWVVVATKGKIWSLVVTPLLSSGTPTGIDTRGGELATRARGDLLCGGYNDGGGGAGVVVTISLVPLPSHAACVKTPV